MDQQRMKRRKLMIHTPPAEPHTKGHRGTHMTKCLVEIGRLLFTHAVDPLWRQLGKGLWGGAVHIANHRVRLHLCGQCAHQTTIHSHKFGRDG